MKTTGNKTISPQQLKALHATFGKIGMDTGARHDCIHSFTGGRTRSSRELTFEEARLLISRLRGEDEQQQRMQLAEAHTLCRSIYFLSTRISFLNKGFPTHTPEDFEMNKAKVDLWARRYSRFQKNIRQMNPAELREVKKQLEAVARREEAEARSAATATDNSNNNQ